MGLPTSSEILGLDIIEWTLPFAPLEAKAGLNSVSLDIIEWTLPFAVNSSGSATPSLNAYVLVNGAWKTVDSASVLVNGAWKTVDSFHTNVSGSWKS